MCVYIICLDYNNGKLPIFVYLVFNLKTKTIFIDRWSRDNHVRVQVCNQLISS